MCIEQCRLTWSILGLYVLDSGEQFLNSDFAEGLCSFKTVLWWHWLQDKIPSYKIPSWGLSSAAIPQWGPWSDSSLCRSQPWSQHMSLWGYPVNLLNRFINLKVACWLGYNVQSFWDLVCYIASVTLNPASPWNGVMRSGGKQAFVILGLAVWTTLGAGGAVKKDALRSKWLFSPVVN